MKKLHVCFICHEYPPGKHGGIGSFTQTLAHRLRSRGHRVSVVGLYRNESLQRESDQGVTVLRIPESSLRYLGVGINAARLSREVRRLSAEQPIDILEGQENAFAFIHARTPGRRVLRMHGGHHFFYSSMGIKPRPVRSWIERRSFRKAQRFCAVSRHVAKETKRLLAIGDRPLTVLPNPVDPKKFHPMPDVPVKPALIVFVGTVCEKKGIRQLILAMPEIIAAVPDARLIAYGRDSKDSTGKSYRQMLESALTPELRNKISFKDHITHSELPSELAAGEILVYPSHMEAHPVAWLEGMAMGKPIVASKTGPGPEIIEHNVCGQLCDPHEPHAIAEAVIRVLQNRELGQRLGAAARERAVKHFSIDKLVVRNEEFYEQCLESTTCE